jgi:hypothetical protein
MPLRKDVDAGHGIAVDFDSYREGHVTFTSFVPVPSDVVGMSQAAERPQGLDGVTVGIMHNCKPNGRELLSAIADLLCERFSIKEVVAPVRSEGIMLPSVEQLDDLASKCDVVLSGLGDCGSCSACSLHVAIDFERRGVPAVAICTKPFLKSSQAMAARQGFEGYRFVMVEHPVSSLGPEEIRERAREALPQVLSILGVDDLQDSAQVDLMLAGLGARQAS